MLARHLTTLKFRMFWSFELSFFFFNLHALKYAFFLFFLVHDYMISDTGVVTTPSGWIPKDSITPKLSPFALLQSYSPQPFWQRLMENHGPHFEFQDSYEETFLTLHFSAADFPFVLSFFDRKGQSLSVHIKKGIFLVVWCSTGLTNPVFYTKWIFVSSQRLGYICFKTQKCWPLGQDHLNLHRTEWKRKTRSWIRNNG